ncbi:Carbonic anhydrase 2 [Lamellibrachia satsuma]|nr:Carbonic anhydrase 2 [Lamellibrachia satsuma]
MEITAPLGPAHWGQYYKDCNRENQSPINIEVSQASHDSSLGEFYMVGYHKKQGRLILKNNGHTDSMLTHVVSVTIAQVDTLGANWELTYGSLDDTYRLQQFHFHWGRDSNTGSDHTIDSKRYPLEMHMVHISTRYDDISNAFNAYKNLTVLATMFEVGPFENAAFRKLTNKLGKVLYKGKNVTLSTFAIRDLMPSNLADYYTYEGSLTTPPCSEVVIWNIFRETVKISERQLKAFRRLKTFAEHTEGEGLLSGNYRPLQSLNRRTVWKSFIEEWCY